MNAGKKARWAGLAFLGVLVACAPKVRELGDEPTPGSAGSTGTSGAGGSGTVPGKGGSGGSSVPGKGGSGGSHIDPEMAGSGGDAGAPATPKPCFSPTRHTELLFDDDAVGCPCNATDPVCVNNLRADPPWWGQLECEDGHWKSVPPTCDTDCFAPQNSPQLALVDPNAGCACAGEPGECVEVSDNGRPHDLAFECMDGRWQSVEDGACGLGSSARCRVDGVTYPHGARHVPNPGDTCNTCVCNDGTLEQCTTAECLDTPCPEGAFYARRCVECGPADGCATFEIGCLSGPGCATGICQTSMCP